MPAPSKSDGDVACAKVQIRTHGGLPTRPAESLSTVQTSTEKCLSVLLADQRNTTSRPDAATAVHNLFLASDYVRTNTDVATMEAANEAARRAVNAILDAARSTARRCDVWPLREPRILAPLRALDRVRFREEQAAAGREGFASPASGYRPPTWPAPPGPEPVEVELRGAAAEASKAGRAR